MNRIPRKLKKKIKKQIFKDGYWGLLSKMDKTPLCNPYRMTEKRLDEIVESVMKDYKQYIKENKIYTWF
jgi:hypothetical protein